MMKLIHTEDKHWREGVEGEGLSLVTGSAVFKMEIRHYHDLSLVITLQHNDHDGDPQQLGGAAKTLSANGDLVGILEELSPVGGWGITWQRLLVHNCKHSSR